MGFRDTSSSSGSDAADHDDRHDGYVPPRLERLGSLAELTLGGQVGPDDGLGGAGDEGSV